MPALVQQASRTADGLHFSQELSSVSERKEPDTRQTDLELKWGKDGERDE